MSLLRSCKASLSQSRLSVQNKHPCGRGGMLCMPSLWDLFRGARDSRMHCQQVLTDDRVLTINPLHQPTCGVVVVELCRTGSCGLGTTELCARVELCEPSFSIACMPGVLKPHSKNAHTPQLHNITQLSLSQLHYSTPQRLLLHTHTHTVFPSIHSAAKHPLCCKLVPQPNAQTVCHGVTCR